MYDAILIPGGGLKIDGTLPEWTVRRLDKAIEMFSGEEYIIVLSAGTVYNPAILDDKGNQIYESVAAADYLLKKGIKKENILTEKVSLDTIGNAYFARTIHVEPLKMKRLLIINSEFHMARTKAIFEWVFSLTPLPVEYKIDYIEVSDEGFDEEVIKVRKEKELKGIEQLEETKKDIHTMAEIHKWLYTKHSAYATGLKPGKINGRILDSY